MDLSPSDLALFYLGGAFILIFVWGIVLGEIVMDGSRPRAVVGVYALTALGVVNPIAAVFAFDLVRLGRSYGDEMTFPGWIVGAIAAAFAVGLGLVALAAF